MFFLFPLPTLYDKIIYVTGCDIMESNIIDIFTTENELHINYPNDRKYDVKEIYELYWNDFIKDNPKLNIRETVFYNVNRMLNCRTPKLGGSVWECPTCGYSCYHFFTCKSRSCPTCGAKYSNQRVLKAQSVMFSAKHRHITFTIAKELRVYFRIDRNMLNLLFEAISITFSSWAEGLSKKEKYKLGFIQVLHTFGRANFWNPHMHVLVAEVAMGNFTVEKKIDFFPYNMLRKRFQTVLLKLMKKYIKKNLPDKYQEYIEIQNKIYKNNKNGFYVRAPKQQFSSIKGGLEYILRYCGRPTFASSRIIKIENDYITFWYQRHEDDKYVVEQIHVYEFIKRLIMHIPEKGFKTTRYYGFYSKHHKQEKHYHKMINKRQYEIKKQFLNWRLLSMQSFNEDPYKCKKCKSVMNLCFCFRPGEVFF